MSFSRATSEVPPPRSPVHIPTKEPLRHTSPVPVPVSNGRDYREPSPKSIASALLSPASAAVVLPSEKEKTKEREGSVKPPTVAAAAEKKVSLFGDRGLSDRMDVGMAVLGLAGL